MIYFKTRFKDDIPKALNGYNFNSFLDVLYIMPIDVYTFKNQSTLKNLLQDKGYVVIKACIISYYMKNNILFLSCKSHLNESFTTIFFHYKYFLIRCIKRCISNNLYVYFCASMIKYEQRWYTLTHPKIEFDTKKILFWRYKTRYIKKIKTIWRFIRYIIQRQFKGILQCHSAAMLLLWYQLYHLYQIHFTDDILIYHRSMRTLKWLLIYELKLLTDVLYPKVISSSKLNDISIKKFAHICFIMFKLFKFTLNVSQRWCVQSVCKAINKFHWFSGLIQGEVGSGKSYIILALMILYYDHTWYFIYIVPFWSLLEQQYHLFTRLLSYFNIDASIFNRNQKHIHSHVIFSTQSILYSKDIKISSIFAIFFDEEQKFGVIQRCTFNHKIRYRFHATATPIPRTLYLVKIRTLLLFWIVNGVYKRNIQVELWSFTSFQNSIFKYIHDSKSLFVVPRIDNDLKKSCMNVIKCRSLLWSNGVLDKDILIISSRTSIDDWNQIIDTFNQSTRCILIATSIIEIGLNFNKLYRVIILSTDYFSLTQTYQIIGRIAWDGRPGYATLVFDDESFKIKRWKYFILTKCISSLQVSYYDLSWRLEGNIIGWQQSGSTWYDKHQRYNIDCIFNTSDVLIKFLSLDWSIIRNAYIKFLFKQNFDKYI